MSALDNLEPLVREALRAEFRTQRETLDSEIRTIRQTILTKLANYEERIATAEAIVRTLDEKLQNDSNFQITRTKLISIAKALGL